MTSSPSRLYPGLHSNWATALYFAGNVPLSLPLDGLPGYGHTFSVEHNEPQNLKQYIKHLLKFPVYQIGETYVCFQVIIRKLWMKVRFDNSIEVQKARTEKCEMLCLRVWQQVPDHPGWQAQPASLGRPPLGHCSLQALCCLVDFWHVKSFSDEHWPGSWFSLVLSWMPPPQLTF